MVPIFWKIFFFGNHESFDTRKKAHTKPIILYSRGRGGLRGGKPEFPVKIEISPGRILSGENKLKFQSDNGKMDIDQLKFTSQLKELVYPTYYFNVDEDLYKSVQNNSIDINMTVTFVKTTDFQDIEVELNGRQFSIDNKKRIYTQNIDNYLREENNAITLRPLDGAVEIVEVKVQAYDNNND